MVKNPPANVGELGDTGSISGSGRLPGVGSGDPLQYSCLENSMDREAWAGYSLWDCKGSDTTVYTHSLKVTGHVFLNTRNISDFFILLSSKLFSSRR